MPSIVLPLRPTADDLLHLENPHTRKYAAHLLNPRDKIRQRILMERAVVRHAVTALLAQGLRVSVDNGEERTQPFTRVDDVMASIQQTDDESLYVWTRDDVAESDWRRGGWIRLVYGNDGWDVIADHTGNLEVALLSTSKYADDLCEAMESHDEGDHETPEDTPCIESGRDNCDDAGTGEGQYHGRI